MAQTPFPHQLTAAAFLAARGFALLADDMGLGKTRSAVMGADLAQARKILVICPAVVKNTWANEFEKWQQTPRAVTIIDGFVQAPPGAEVSIISHACLADMPPGPNDKRKGKDKIGNSWRNIWAAAPYDLIIVDEIHQLRDYNAVSARNFLMPGALWTAAPRVWGLTGTPIVNSAADFWLIAFGPLRMSVMWFDWCSHFCEMKPAYDGLKPVGIKNAGELANLLAPHTLRRTLASVGFTLPLLTVAQHTLDLPKTALTEVMALLDNWSPEFLTTKLEEQGELRDAAIAKVRRILGLAKVPYIAAHILTALRQQGGPVVVFFQHTEVRRQLYEQLTAEGYRVSWIDGTVSRKQVSAAEAWFQAGRLDVLLVQTQAGGVGITLHRANHVIVAELPWTSVALQQAIKRVHRIGQTRPVQADVLRARDCWLEDVLCSVVGRKARACDELLDLLEEITCAPSSTRV